MIDDTRWFLYFTCSAKCLQRCSMKGRFFNIGAKSSDIRYKSLVLFLEEGRQTWSWWRCVSHCLVLFPSSFPGFEIPIVDNTIQGGLNSISIGYGSQYPWRPEDGVRNFTKLQETEKKVKTDSSQYRTESWELRHTPWDTPAFCKSRRVSKWSMRKIQEII